MVTEQIDTLIYIVYNLFIKEVHVIKFLMIFYLQDKNLCSFVYSNLMNNKHFICVVDKKEST